MDICHLKKSELVKKFQKYKGRVVLRGDVVRGDSGSYAVFTEQGSSASPMTVANSDEFLDSFAIHGSKTKFRAEVCSCSGCLADAMLWIEEAEVAKSVDDITTSQSIGERRFPNIISNPYFKKDRS